MAASPREPVPPFLTHRALDASRHGFFTRRGGVSTGVHASLNCGAGSGDAPGNVARNRLLVSAALGDVPLVTARQTHSNRVLVIGRDGGGCSGEGDAMVTTRRGIALAVLTADCVPLLLLDPRASVAGACHAGWRGTLKGITGATVAAMTALGAHPGAIRAVIGPCIRQESYEVGPDFREAFRDIPESAAFFAHGDGDRLLFDLAGLVRLHLEQAGVGEICDTGRDSFRETELFFSRRRAFRQQEAAYGCLISAISLPGTTGTPSGAAADHGSPSDTLHYSPY